MYDIMILFHCICCRTISEGTIRILFDEKLLIIVYFSIENVVAVCSEAHSITLMIKYKRNLETDFDTKKRDCMKSTPSEMDDRTLRLKALCVYLEDISELLQDLEIEYISSSAKVTYCVLRRNLRGGSSEPLKVSIATNAIATCVNPQYSHSSRALITCELRVHNLG